MVQHPLSSGSPTQITPMADLAMAQITQLQGAILSSKQALQDAAVIISTLRPNN